VNLTRGRAAVLVIVLGALALATAGPTWVRAQTATALDPTVAVAVSGGTAAPAVNAAGLVLVAAGLALAIGGRVARMVVLVVVAAAGALITASAIAVATSPADVAAAGAAESAGVTDLTAPATVTVWPWLCAAVGVLVVLAAVLVGIAARGWTTSSGRHERTAPSPGAGTPVDAHDAWDAQTRGTDPTAPEDR
jgi:hypothetical protein